VSSVEKPENHAATPLRIWLRLLTCTNLIESRVRGRLREDFSSTLPRFDMLAQLDMARGSREGLTMGELARRLLVSNGNLTGLTTRLVKEGLVTRTTSMRDRRAQRVRLTAAGKRAFDAMAAQHRAWIESIFGELPSDDAEQLYELLGGLKETVQHWQVNVKAEPAE
jgi:DNA-binding MarR family transcriptional regulator